MDLTSFIRPGDTVLWGQGTGEPQTLTESLVRRRSALPGTTIFLGSSFSGTLRPEHADCLRFLAIGGVGRNVELSRAGCLEVIPCHISALPGLIKSGRLKVDVVLVQLSSPGPDGRHSLGLIGDYLPTAIEHARVVVGEINDQVPYTHGDGHVDPARLHAALYTSRSPVTLAQPTTGDLEDRIGSHVADLVPDGAVVELGIGSVMQAIATRLAGKRDLGVHTGAVGDWIVDLTESGAVTNATKPIDRGVSVTGAVFGTTRLYEFVHDNPSIELRRIEHTHDPTVLRRLDPFYAINSAIEIDLSGQVNAETLGGIHVGAVGGQVDFVRGAMACPGGRSIIALPSTARHGSASRIVARLPDGVTTTPRSDADLVVTEHGVADLRGASLPQRARRLIAIAGDAFRDELEAAARDFC
jgi:acetyl-CoA hydrolase